MNLWQKTPFLRAFCLSCISMYLAHPQSKGKVENLVRVCLLWQCASLKKHFLEISWNISKCCNKRGFISQTGRWDAQLEIITKLLSLWLISTFYRASLYILLSVALRGSEESKVLNSTLKLWAGVLRWVGKLFLKGLTVCQQYHRVFLTPGLWMGK